MIDEDGPALLSPKQRQSIIEADTRVNLWHGSVSSGKTIASILAWLDFIAYRAPKRGEVFMIGNTLQTLERNVLNVIAEMHPGLIDHTTGSGTAVLFPGTPVARTVACIGANDLRAEKRIRGATAAAAYVDEATLLPGSGYWSQLLNRLRLPGSQLFATTNPDNPNHWLKTDVIDRAAELGYRVWHFTLADNPALTDEYKTSIERENVGLWKKRNVLGLWVLAEGAIYEGFDTTPDGPHVVTRLPAPDHLTHWTLAVDYGTTNPFVALLMCIGRSKGVDRIYVAREWRWDSKARQAQKTDAEYSMALRRWLDELAVDPALAGCQFPEWFIYDPSAASFGVQVSRDGWGAHSYIRGADNAVSDGIRSVSSLMAIDRIKIHESCDGLIGEKVGYVWDEKASKAGKEEPLKVADHGPDAERYGVMALQRYWGGWLTRELPAAA